MLDTTDPADGLRSAMRLSAQPVSVVTAQADGVARGLTVSSFTSLSLEPPLLSFALNNETLFLPVVRESGRFALHILGARQEAVAIRFALPGQTPAEQFEGVEATLDNDGTPALPHFLSRIAGTVDRLVEVGDHTLVICRVESVFLSDTDEEPLLYFDRAFRQLA